MSANILLGRKISRGTNRGTLTERLSTVDLLVLSSLEQLLFILKVLFTIFTKQTALRSHTLAKTSAVMCHKNACLKQCLHYGDNRSKLELLKMFKNYNFFFKTHQLRTIIDVV